MGKLNFMSIKKCFHFVVVVLCQLIIPLIIIYMIYVGWKVVVLIAF